MLRSHSAFHSFVAGKQIQDSFTSELRDFQPPPSQAVESSNRPIFAPADSGPGIKVPIPFTIRYRQEPRGREFVKLIRKPTSHRLNDREVLEIAKSLIVARRLYPAENWDTIGRGVVVNRLRVVSDIHGAKAAPEVIVQRAILHRSFFGTEVVNSRILVDVHPETREVLAVKRFEWDPVDKSSGKKLPFITLGASASRDRHDVGSRGKGNGGGRRLACLLSGGSVCVSRRCRLFEQERRSHWENLGGATFGD